MIVDEERMILVPVADWSMLVAEPRAATMVFLVNVIWESPFLALNLRVASTPAPLLPSAPTGTT